MKEQTPLPVGEHPLPWRVEKYQVYTVCRIIDANSKMVAYELDQNNSEYIVRCVNHCDRLAKALRILLKDAALVCDEECEAESILAEWDAAKGTK